MKAQKNPVDRYVDMRLKEWAGWYKKFLEHGLGYPSMSIEGRLRADGGILSRSTAIPMPPTHKDAEEVALCINELSFQKPFWALSVKIRYLHNGDKTKIRQSQMSPGTYKNNLRLANAWLAGRISS